MYTSDEKNVYKNYYFAALGDSITSDQVTGIGTEVCKKLGTSMHGNYACGWATCSDWHVDHTNLTTPLLTHSPNAYQAQNVLSNQVLHLLHHAKETGIIPDIVYIAISTNDGSVDIQPQTPTPVFDDTELVFSQTCEELSRCSIASALRWAIETLRVCNPNVALFVASPLQAYSPTRELGALSEEAGLLKREIIRKVCEFCQVTYIDSYAESGYTRDIAKDHGEVHPDPEWKERIAQFVAERIHCHLTQKTIEM